MTTLSERRESKGTGAGYPTIATRCRDWAERVPDQVVMRDKDLGIWQETTWGQLWETVLDAAHGLLSLGVDVGDRVSIHSEDRPEWVVLDIATVAVRGITVGLYPTNPATEVRYLLENSGAEVHLVEDQEQADKVMEVIDHLPGLRWIIHLEPRGFRPYRDDRRFISWEDFLALGREHRAANPGEVERIMAEADQGDVMTLVYTSGTTGPPKGAMLTNANAEYSMGTVINGPGRIPDGRPPNSSDMILTYLPLCHVAERIFSTWTMLADGVVLNFAESIETVQANLREVQPTLFFAVPRILEKIHATILIKGLDATFLKRLLFRGSMRLADVIGKQKVANGGDHTLTSRLLYGLGYVLVFRALRERIGLRRCRWAGSGAAPIAPEILRFFLGIGVPVYELYGMTENTAVATVNLVHRMKLGTVGEPYAGTGLRIDEETGEIQTKHPGVFLGYWQDPAATAETFTEDGWLKTGDVGIWVDGTHVKIVDRIKHIIITAGGKNISPSEIENRLKTSPWIKEAMVVGDRRKFLSALIGIELDTVGDWATRKGIPYTTYRDLTEKPQVLELVQQEVNRVNTELASVEQIKRFCMIPKELDHEDGELTATQKLKRNAMEGMFSDLVESMY